jgi:hypothetical protein
VRGLAACTKGKFAKADVEMSCLSNIVGDRTEEMGTMMAFDMRTLIGKDLARLGPLEHNTADHSSKQLGSQPHEDRVVIQELGSGSNPSEQWKNTFLEELKTEIEPVFRLYTKLSSSFATPADYLEKA